MKFFLSFIGAVLASGLAACGPIGSVQSMNATQSISSSSDSDSGLQAAINYADGDAFPQDLANASTTPPTTPTTAPVCSATDVQDEITRVQNFIAFIQTNAPAGSAWEQCILDLLNQRLTDLQTLLTQVQGSTPTQSCWSLMMTIVSGQTPPASCHPASTGTAGSGAGGISLTCTAGEVQNAITGVQNAITAIQTNNATAFWEPCAVAALNQQLTNLQTLLTDVNAGSVTGSCFSELITIASGQTQPAACTPSSAGGGASGGGSTGVLDPPPAGNP